MSTEDDSMVADKDKDNDDGELLAVMMAVDDLWLQMVVLSRRRKKMSEWLPLVSTGHTGMQWAPF